MTEEGIDAAVTYQIRPLNMSQHLFEVSCLIERPAASGQRVSLPAWIPGSYLVRDYARHVVAIEADSDGEPVRLQKIDKSTWRAGPVSGPLRLTAEIYANDLSVRGAYLDDRHAFINGVCVFLRVHEQEQEACVVHLLPHAGGQGENWRIATGMQRLTGTDLDYGAFFAANYDELIDQPLLIGEIDIGEFDVAGVPHRIAIVGNHDGDMDRLCGDVAQIAEAQRALFESPLPFDHYTFLLTVLNEGYGGLEHRNSCALVCGRDDLPRDDDERMTERYRKLLGLFSHEYFHLWNVKRIKPSEFVPYELTAENYTRQLWIFEGITSYYDDLALLRSDVVSETSYLELLGQSLTRVYRNEGRRRQTLEDSSFDAWIKFYRPDENTPNSVVSYYSKGAMIALALDLELRLRTNGGASLDDIMRAAWSRYGAEGSAGLRPGEFEALAAEVSGQDLDEFFDQALRSHIDPPVGILLAQFGVRLAMRAPDNEADAGGVPAKRRGPPRPTLGFRVRTQSSVVSVASIERRNDSDQQSIAAHDELVALNGRRVTPANYESLLSGVRIGEVVRVDVFRRSELVSLSIAATAPPRDRCYLEIDPDADEDAVQRRAAWLG